MAYLEKGDFLNAATWLEKAMNDVGNDRRANATKFLAQMHKDGIHPHASKDEALRLYGLISGNAMPKIHMGFLYYFGKEIQKDTSKGFDLIEKGIEQLKMQNNDSDSYLTVEEYFSIASIYLNENMTKKTKEYLLKTIDKCGNNPYVSDIKAQAENILRQLN